MYGAMYGDAMRKQHSIIGICGSNHLFWIAIVTPATRNNYFLHRLNNHITLSVSDTHIIPSQYLFIRVIVKSDQTAYVC